MDNSSPSSFFDVLLVGSGINALVCAAMLARDGRRVHVLEREQVHGGCIRTDELTLPGFAHDTLSTAHPLFVVGPAHAELGEALRQAGMEYCNNDTPTGVLMTDGRSLVLSTSRERNLQAFESCRPGAGAAYAAAMADVQNNAELVFALLGQELWRWPIARLLARKAWNHGPLSLSGFFGAALEPARAWLERAFGDADSPVAALLAPWTLHAGLGPDSPVSALMDKVVAFTLEAVGMPLVKGGNAGTVRALRSLIERAGSSLETGADVEQVLVEGGRARGVRLRDGRELLASDVVCSVTPTQLYLRLLSEQTLPPELLEQARAYRHGKGNMQIHLALSEAPRWPDAALGSATYLHLSGGANAVSRAVNEAERGLLPAQPTICVAQPTAVDPSRAPEGHHILWIQLPECPRQPRGDAAGQIELDPAAGWIPELREAYAERVIDAVARHAPNLRASILGRSVLSPADLERLNINLVGGDPYGGDCGLDQSFLWRPLRGQRNHETPVAHLWHIGASTHPGPGLSGTSGFQVARLLSRR